MAQHENAAASRAMHQLLARGPERDTVNFHKACELFPNMVAADYRELVADIREHGLLEPIVLHEGAVLDGRNRYRACKELGIKPRYREHDDGDPFAFVISMNLKRRHLNETQRAMIGARLIAMYEKAARERQGRRTDIKPNLAGSERGQARDHAARQVNVSHGTTESARKVIADGVPALVDMCDAGAVAVSAAAKVAELPQEKQCDLVARIKDGRAKHLRDALRQQSYEQKQERAIDDVAAGRYSVIYGDPPWQYSNTGFATNQSRLDGGAAAGHYPTMPTEEICALPIAEHTTDDAVCFLWVTNPLLEDGLRVLGAWGFEYKTNLVWVKDRGTYLGFYVNGYHELLLIGTKGSLLPDSANRPRSVIESERAEHSRKPDSVYTMIGSMYPGLPCLELFARRSREGWTSWGNETT